jgi:hypothetical protein
VFLDKSTLLLNISVNIPPVSGSALNNQNVLDSIDAYIDSLNLPNNTTVAVSTVTKTVGVSAKPDELVVVPPQTDEEMKTFILKHSARLVENSVKSILELQKMTVATGDPEMMTGLAGLMAASTGAIEAISKLHLQNQKTEAAKELRRMSIEGQKDVQKLRNEGTSSISPNQTNILIATREEIIAQLTGKAKAKPVEDIYEIETVPLSASK